MSVSMKPAVKGRDQMNYWHVTGAKSYVNIGEASFGALSLFVDNLLYQFDLDRIRDLAPAHQVQIFARYIAQARLERVTRRRIFL